MFVKQVKRKCSVRGCKNTECFAISRTREIGNTVIICKSCLGQALGCIDEVNPKTKSNIPVNDAPAPALFYNAQALGLNKADSHIPPNLSAEAETDDVTPPTESDTAPASADEENEDENKEPDNPISDSEPFICPHCGKGFDSDRGLMTHLRYCKRRSEE